MLIFIPKELYIMTELIILFKHFIKNKIINNHNCKEKNNCSVILSLNNFRWTMMVKIKLSLNNLPWIMMVRIILNLSMKMIAFLNQCILLKIMVLRMILKNRMRMKTILINFSLLKIVTYNSFSRKNTTMENMTGKFNY